MKHAIFLFVMGLEVLSGWARAAETPAVKTETVSLAPLDALTAPDTPFVSGDCLVFLGDSITQNADWEKGFIGRFRAAFAKRTDLHVAIYNCGISGHQVPHVQERLMRDVIDLGPSVVFFYIGINDVWHWLDGTGTSVADYEAGLRDIIGRLQQRGIIVVLATPSVIGEKRDNAQDKMLEQYAEISRKVAHDMHIEVCDLRKAFTNYLRAHNRKDDEKGILTVDRVHLSEDGNALVAATAAPSLIAALRRQALTPVIPTCDFIGNRENPILLHEPTLPEGVTLHYTLDGGEPTLKSPVYNAPIHLTNTTTIAARTFNKNSPASPVVRVTSSRIMPQPAVKVDVQPGLTRRYYEGKWKVVPDFAMLKPVETKIVPVFDVNSTPKAEDYAVQFQGYFMATETGVYGFRLGGYNHVVMALDGKSLWAYHNGHDEPSRIIQVPLEAGLHPIEVGFVQEAGSGRWLFIEVNSPHNRDAPNATELFHKVEKETRKVGTV